jgi:hypothetical protein
LHDLAKPEPKLSDAGADTNISRGLEPKGSGWVTLNQPKQEPLDWLPKHAAALYITHNEHKGVYESVEDRYGHLEDCDWVSPEEKQKAIELDSVWELHWYPDTPIGSYYVAASSLEAIQKHMVENGDAYR